MLQYIQSNIQKNIIFYLPGLQTPLPCFGKDAYSNLISLLAHSLPSKRKRKNAETWQKSLANLAKNPLEVVAICQKYQNS
ncbi:MAG: hypothetical protein D6756_10670 [Cyanobacteria bacterium J083]|nr:MAG: hypothetical protein D6756_10670 [Cyanobacteria bacterium J083]